MNKTAVHAIIMVLTTILAKVLGFCRELSLAFSYGASNNRDWRVIYSDGALTVSQFAGEITVDNPEGVACMPKMI